MIPKPSALLTELLHINNWIKSFQLEAGILGGEAPVDANLVLVSLCFPSNCLLADKLDISYARV